MSETKTLRGFDLIGSSMVKKATARGGHDERRHERLGNAPIREDAVRQANESQCGEIIRPFGGSASGFRQYLNLRGTCQSAAQVNTAGHNRPRSIERRIRCYQTFKQLANHLACGRRTAKRSNPLRSLSLLSQEDRMKTALHANVQGARDFLQNGSKVVSALLMVSLVVAVLALLPLGTLVQAPAASTGNSSAPGGPVLSQRREALKDQWLERRTEVVLPQPFSRERQDVLKEQWLVRRSASANVNPAAAIQRQEELKDLWLA